MIANAPPFYAGRRKNMKKIGLFGGTFDPVHREHVALASCALNALQLDRLIVIPALLPPHKRGRNIAPPADRLAMCRLAFTEAGEEVSDWELNRGETSYSYLTCRHFRELYPQDELYFVMGTDMFDSFDTWKNPDQIVRCVKLAVCRRDKEAGYLQAAHAPFVARYGADFVELPFDGAPVSSTRLRTVAALGGKLEDVSNEVASYIRTRNLYAEPLLQRALALEKQSRREHSVRVALMAVENARRFGVDETKALYAAGLHDCAKNLSPDSEYLKGFVPPEGCPPPVVHQYAGAYVAEHTFGITDEEILDAVRYHTSGRPHMTPLGKLVFLSDMLEEGRSYPGVETLRALFRSDADRCLKESLKRQLVYLSGAGFAIDPLTQRTYDSLIEKEGE